MAFEDEIGLETNDPTELRAVLRRLVFESAHPLDTVRELMQELQQLRTSKEGGIKSKAENIEKSSILKLIERYLVDINNEISEAAVIQPRLN